MASRLPQLTGANAVVIFSWVRCPFCAKAKTLLNSLSKDVAVYELDQMAEGNALHQEIITATNGHDTVPAVWVRNEFVGGFSEVDALHKQGKLAKMLSE